MKARNDRMRRARGGRRIPAQAEVRRPLQAGQFVEHFPAKASERKSEGSKGKRIERAMSERTEPYMNERNYYE
jgi:hypothetical protein